MVTSHAGSAHVEESVLKDRGHVPPPVPARMFPSHCDDKCNLEEGNHMAGVPGAQPWVSQR